jgi:Uma2 family endonuclease
MTPPIRTLADLLVRLGGVPLNRIRFRPAPGSATLQDVIDAGPREDILCKLVDGVLVQKAPGFLESSLGGFMGMVMNALVTTRNLGIVTGTSGAFELRPGLVRIPCFAFTDWDRMPGRRCPTAPIPRLAPNLVVEVLRRSNTPGEMVAKRRDYFGAGVELVWEIDPDRHSVVVYTSVSVATTLGPADSLDGGTVLPGFTLAVRDLFAELDRAG